MKEVRQNVITDLISNRPVSSQAGLVKLLRKRGFEVTQASVSRDLEELQIRKSEGRYRLSSGQGFAGSFGEVTITGSGDSLIVARCGSGLASALAVHLDSLELDQVAGTLAGDDTVFIAARTARGQKSLLKQLKERFGC